ncbi:MAG: hypothetical protein CMA27_04040 [Euryarchaeota archaeon]|nr:hypothetical protein [Euryarchaeota archaeon]|tara:strand:+ start:1015 stop:1431 length:417 start_codon:yes stop_codon:yes gene_type:complete
MTLENRLNKIKRDWNITKNRFINTYPRSKVNKNDRAFITSKEKLDSIKNEINSLYEKTKDDTEKNGKYLDFFNNYIENIKETINEKKIGLVTKTGENLSGNPLKIDKYNNNSLAYINITYYMISIFSMSFFIYKQLKA